MVDGWMDGWMDGVVNGFKSGPDMDGRVIVRIDASKHVIKFGED
jgi:hypothetical protein